MKSHGTGPTAGAGAGKPPVGAEVDAFPLVKRIRSYATRPHLAALRSQAW